MEKMAKIDKEQLFDCIITCGERDPDWYGHYKKELSSEKWLSTMSLEKKLWHGTAQPSA